MKTMLWTDNLREREYEARRRLMELQSSARMLQQGGNAKHFLLYVALGAKAAVEWQDSLDALATEDPITAKVIRGDYAACNARKKAPELWTSFTSTLAEAEDAWKRCDINRGDKMLKAIRDEAIDRLEGLSAKIAMVMLGVS